MDKIPSFCPLACFAFGGLPANMPLFRVFRGFLAWFLLFRVGLLGLGALRGLWGFCVREWLGGYMTCGDFLQNLSFCPFVFFFSPLVLLSPALLLGFLPCLLSSSLSCFLGFVAWLLVLVGLLFLFPFRTIRKKKGRNSLRPLFVGCWLVMQNKVFRPRKIHNRWPRFLRRYIRLSKYICNHSATARKNLQEGSRQIPSR